MYVATSQVWLSKSGGSDPQPCPLDIDNADGVGQVGTYQRCDKVNQIRPCDEQSEENEMRGK